MIGLCFLCPRLGSPFQEGLFRLGCPGSISEPLPCSHEELDEEVLPVASWKTYDSYDDSEPLVHKVGWMKWSGLCHLSRKWHGYAKNVYEPLCVVDRHRFQANSPGPRETLLRFSYVW